MRTSTCLCRSRLRPVFVGLVVGFGLGVGAATSAHAKDPVVGGAGATSCDTTCRNRQEQERLFVEKFAKHPTCVVDVDRQRAQIHGAALTPVPSGETTPVALEVTGRPGRRELYAMTASDNGFFLIDVPLLAVRSAKDVSVRVAVPGQPDALALCVSGSEKETPTRIRHDSRLPQSWPGRPLRR